MNPFKYNYKMETVDADKGIVSLQPTLGAFGKAMMPSLIIFGVLLGAGAVAEFAERRTNKKLSEDEMYPDFKND